MTRPPAKLLLLVMIAAAARLVLQSIVLPPYAGLDEAFHVGFLAFRVQEGRSPTSVERSIPPYVIASIWNHPNALPSFGQLGAKWPQVVRERREIVIDRPLRESDKRPYVVKNYEAQQPGLYYAIAAPFARWLPNRSAVRELLVWRALSVVFSLLIVFGAALIGWRCAGPVGLLTAALIPCLPTWETFVVRASNDALACAFLALACAATLGSRFWILDFGFWIERTHVRESSGHVIQNPKSQIQNWLEGALWFGALATKLYAWPVWILVPFAMRHQRAPRARWIAVIACSAGGVVWTIADLAARTGNPFGLFAFNAPATTRAASVAIDYPLMGKIFVLTGAWTSGQHWNSLTWLAIELLFIPLFAVLALSLTAWRTHRWWLIAMGIVIVTFAAAQLVNVAGYIRLAHAAGASLPAGGKEAWYWYALAPLFMGVLFPLGLKRLMRAWPLVVAIVIWIVGWDVLIHEGALFQDFAGLTSPERSSALFAWAPAVMPFSATVSTALARVALTKWVHAATVLRAIHVVAVMLLLVSIVSERKIERTSQATA